MTGLMLKTNSLTQKLNWVSIIFLFLESVYETKNSKLNHVRSTNIYRLDEHYEPTFQTASISIYKIRHIKRLNWRLSSIFKIANSEKNQPIWHFISLGFHPVTWPQPLNSYGTLTPIKYKGSRPSCFKKISLCYDPMFILVIFSVYNCTN